MNKGDVVDQPAQMRDQVRDHLAAAATLTPREFELLRELAVNAGKVLTQGMLLSRVWGPEFRDESHILRTFIYQLRLKLDEAKPGTGSMVVTDPRVGYRLETPKP